MPGAVLRGRAVRSWWLTGVVLATATCTAFGLLSITGVIGRSVVF